MLRITGGEFRGRIIQAPSNQKTRPTQAKLRQALFNSLQALIPDARVLDLFAGSGSLGFEALSRGATEVVFVESSRQAVALIEKNAKLLHCEDRARIVTESVESWCKRYDGEPFDLVMADPPYADGWEDELLKQSWNKLLKDDGVFCLEWGTQKSHARELPEKAPFLVKVREKNYGDSVLTTYRRDPQEGSDA